MKFDIQKIKSTFQSFNTYQKIAGVVLALAIPLSIGLGISAIGANSGTDGGSFSQMVSSITSVVKPSSVISSSSLASSSKKAVKVSLKPSSVEEDLEVQVVGENGQMIVGPEFKLIVKGTKNGSIILFHNGVENTAPALDKILTELSKQGYTFVSVDDLIYKDNYTIDHTGRQYKTN